VGEASFLVPAFFDEAEPELELRVPDFFVDLLVDALE
jgi:hypothetical protein